MEATEEQIVNALERFFAEDAELADKAGYELTVGVRPRGASFNILVDVDTLDEALPKINVYPRQKANDTWAFLVDVSFPDIDLSEYSMTGLLDVWRNAALLADDIASIQFVYSQWAE